VKKKHLIIPILLSSLILSACSQKDEEAESSASTMSTTSQAKTQPEGKVISLDPALAKKGEGLYNQNCVFCHQADAIGKPGFAPSLTNKEFLSVSSNKFLMGTIRDGRPGTGMPPFSHLGREKVEAIVAFLRAHSTESNISEAVDAQPESHGDPRLGKIWFDQICSTCHGENGDGYSAGSTGTAIGKAGFLNKVTDGFIRFTIVNGRTDTRMLGFKGPAAMADLSDHEIEDIIAYMRTEPSK